MRVRWEGLVSLDVSDNLLRELPTLPSRLEVLRCSHNFLSYLPPLPASLKILDASDNGLSRLPELPSGIESVDLLGNPFTASPFRVVAEAKAKVEAPPSTFVDLGVMLLVFSFLWMDRFWSALPGSGKPLEGVTRAFFGRLEL